MQPRVDDPAGADIALQTEAVARDAAGTVWARTARSEQRMRTRTTPPFNVAGGDDEPAATHRRRGIRAPRRPLLALLAATTLIVAACGAGPASTPAAASAASTGTPGPTPTSVAATPSQAPTAGNGAIAALQQEYETVVQRVSPSVVVIETSAGLGSGIILDSTGDIVTNAHVVGSATTFNVTLADGRQFPGTLVGTFPANDIAVISIHATNLTPATFADSSSLKVGQIVLAVGNPLGLQTSVTQGIISALGRTVTEPGGMTLPGTIQTSASINPGNSGGALVDIQGNVVGIPTLAAVDQQIGGSAPGIGFAIPSNAAKDFAGQLIASGKVTNSHRAYLGIRAADVLGAQGVLVYSVDAAGPAATAGIKAGELIVSIDGKPTPDSSTLSVVLAGLEPGQTVPVVVMTAAGSQSTIQVTLGQIPG
jgi:S1-C subfamily serine protease